MLLHYRRGLCRFKICMLPVFPDGNNKGAYQQEQSPGHCHWGQQHRNKNSAERTNLVLHHLDAGKLQGPHQVANE